MAGSVNKVILLGNCGADPEIRRTQDGRPIASIRLATSENWRDRESGERREKTEWHSIVVFNEGLCKVIEQYVKKGSKIYVEGQLKTRKWQDQSGNDRYSTEIVLQGFNCTLQLLDKPQGSGYQPGGNGGEDFGGDPDRAAGNSSRTQQSSTSDGNLSRDLDDDIPF
jgi:single-strand DNA-binding protein